MLGAIIGDMAGSVYEKRRRKTKDVQLFNIGCEMTDDSLLTLAVAKTLMNHYPVKYDEESLKNIQKDLIREFAYTWRANPGAGYGYMFSEWCKSALSGNPEPYNSYGNGSAMRISPVGWIAENEKQLKILSKTVTEITHNHPEGIKGAEAVSLCIYLALHGFSKEEIRERMINEYYPEIASLDFEDLVENYGFSPTCKDSVPQAVYCFLISESLEETIKRCIMIGGDCDTTSAMAGSIAEAYYQKDNLSDFEKKYLYYMIDPEIERIIKKFHKTIGNKKFE